MPRYNVNHNNKWAVFSSIVDAFISTFGEKDALETYRKLKYGSDYVPLEQSNLMTMKEAVSSIRLHHTSNESIVHLVECGIDLTEAEKLIYDIETEEYCPIPKENGKYECPNCGADVEKGQIECNDESCPIEFVWRD